MVLSSLTTVIPSVGFSAYLAEALTSVARQSRPPARIVLFCNGWEPTLEQKQSIQNWACVEVVSVESKLPIGLSWNRAVACATTEWVHLLHDDDWIEPSAYEIFAQDEAKKNCGLWLGGTREHVMDTGAVSMIQTLDGLYQDPIEVASVIFVHERSRCSSIVLRKAAFEHCGGFSALMHQYVDKECFFRLAVRSGLKENSSLFGSYRVHCSSISGFRPKERKIGYVENGALANDISFFILNRIIYGSAWPSIRDFMLKVSLSAFRYAIRRGQIINIAVFLRLVMKLKIFC